MYVRSPLVYALTHRRLAVPYRRFGTTYGSRNVGKELPLYAAFNHNRQISTLNGSRRVLYTVLNN
jgi:hypothetical protein